MFLHIELFIFGRPYEWYFNPASWLKTRKHRLKYRFSAKYRASLDDIPF